MLIDLLIAELFNDDVSGVKIIRSPSSEMTDVKVKLSLSLPKHHAVKNYRCSGGIAPTILNLGSRWK